MMEKVSQSQRPVALWSETSLKSEDISNNQQPLLYQLETRFEVKPHIARISLFGLSIIMQRLFYFYKDL